MAEETEIPVVLKLFAQKTSSVNSVLQETKKGFNDLAGEVTSVARSAAVLSGSFTVALGGIVAAAVNVAGKFESLQAKLTSTLGDSESAAIAFQQAIQLAATTPFDVQGIVQASVQITAFGQSAQRVLPLAANLAAAFSERVEDVGQILGKAFSGSLEGFESLRSRLGISNVLLQKFGAELTKTGGISVQSADDLRKAQDALEAIIKTRFGDATARQSQTLFGALSNLSDSIQRAASAFGAELIPIVTSAARALTSVIEKFENLSPATRQTVALAALAAVGIGALATGALALGAALVTGVAAVSSFAGALGTISGAAAGTAAVAKGFSVLGGAATLLGGELATVGAIVAAIIGPFGALALLVGGAVAIAIQQYASATAAADKAVVDQARSLTAARNSLRDYVDAIESVTGAQGKLMAQAGQVSSFAAGVQESLSNLTGAEFLSATEKAGISLESLNKDLEKNRNSANLLKDRVAELSRAYLLLQGFEKNEGAFSLEDLAFINRVQESLGNVNATSKDVGDSLKLAETSLQNLLQAGSAMTAFKGRFEETAPVLAGISQEASRLQDFLKFASKTNDVGVLNASFVQLEQSIGLVEQKLGQLGIPYGSLVELQKRFLTGSTQEKAAIQDAISLREAQEEIQKKLVADEKRSIQEKIRTEEAALERKKILSGEDKKAEIAKYQELLQLVEKNSQEELSLLGKIANAKQALKRKEVADVKATLSELVGTSNQGLETLRATGEATATDTSNALRQVLQQLDEWGRKNAALIKQNPQLAQEFKATVAGFQGKLNTSELEKPKEKLREAIDAAKEFGVEAVTNTQKFAAAEQALEVLRKFQDSNQLKSKSDKVTLQNEINRLTKEEVTLQAAITKENDAQARQTAGLRREGLSQDLELLKQQQAIQGKSPFLANQIADKEKQILAERVQAIREQEQQEIDSGATKAQAQERTQLRITQLQNEEVLKRINAEQAATSAYASELQKRQAEEQRYQQQRQGGPNSPLISLGELSATSGFLGNFSLGQINQDLSGGRRQPDQNQLLRVRQSVARDISQGDALAGRKTDPSAPGQAPSPTSGGDVKNISININGNAADKPTIKLLAAEALKELLADNKLRGQV